MTRNPIELFVGAVVGRLRIATPAGTYEIVKRVGHVAYARNGNTHNPTVTYTWTVTKSLMVLSSPLPTRRAAVDFIVEHARQSSEGVEP